MERHYGMDWLRIGAFALLILYHVGMVFVPWGFEVKTVEPLAWAEIPMFLTNPWRLSLLFVVSGFASRALLAKQPGAWAFARSRTARLFAPLLFGMAVLVAPQPWVKLVTQHGYDESFLHFYAVDYFRFGTLDGEILPTWMHLWFVVYLWAYSLLLALALGWMRGGVQPRLQRLFDRMFAGGRVLWVPLAYVVLIQSLLFRRGEDTHDFFTDFAAHARYIPMFLFGFGLAGSAGVRAALAERWRLSGGLAMAAFATIAALLILFPDFSFPDEAATWTYRLARDVETWTAIAALVGIAERFLNRDHNWRPMLAEAVFPFYIIHQTVIVVVMFWIKPLGLAPLAEFAILVAATVAGCWAFYLGGREIGWLRPLIGLKPSARRRASTPRGAPVAG